MQLYLLAVMLNTLSTKFCDTVVTLSLSKGLVSQSLSEEKAKAEILRLRCAPLRMTCLIL